jgi:hypothetical protein
MWAKHVVSWCTVARDETVIISVSWSLLSIPCWTHNPSFSGLFSSQACFCCRQYLKQTSHGNSYEINLVQKCLHLYIQTNLTPNLVYWTDFENKNIIFFAAIQTSDHQTCCLATIRTVLSWFPYMYVFFVCMCVCTHTYTHINTCVYIKAHVRVCVTERESMYLTILEAVHFSKIMEQTHRTTWCKNPQDHHLTSAMKTWK